VSTLPETPHFMRATITLAGALGAAFAALPACADPLMDPVTEQVQVTATRSPESVSRVPASVTVISGQELRDRGATDLASALTLVAGVEAPAGGDAGPASAVPSLLGLHEFDAFLLVVDGVPWGGAFNPSIATLDLTDVERIEVLKGSAPVTYGATSFVGVIQVIHYPAGQAENRVRVGYGTHREARGSLSVALPAIGDYQQSLTLEGSSQGFYDTREQVSDGKLLYRGATTLGGGQLRIDLDLTYERTVPPSPVIRQGNALTTLTPLNANYNPADARIDENRYHGVLGYTHETPIGTWETTASYAFSEITDIRGFLRPDLTDDGSQNADSQHQSRRTTDAYVDSHFNAELADGLGLLYGADMLYGLGKQTSINGAYFAPLSGAVIPPPTTQLHVDEINSISDLRSFFGQYVQIEWHLGRLDLFGGLRLNETAERLKSTHIDGFDAINDLADNSKKSVTRLSGVAGASYQIWQDGRDEAVLYADYRNSFKPAAIDFGPDYTPNVLNPETAQSYEAGVKGRLLHGMLDYDANGFRVDFKNLVVATTDAEGNPILENAGGQRLQGFEAELRAHITQDLTLALSGSYHDSRFTQYIATEGGANVNAAGNELPLSPQLLGSFGLLYEPPTGFYGSVTTNYVGRRFLDLANQAPVGAYATVAASTGYRFGRYDATVTGTNLSNARPPVTESEFGDSSYYLLPGRTIFFSVAAHI
jgi:iron complex outermembrane recepter protein